MLRRVPLFGLSTVIGIIGLLLFWVSNRTRYLPLGNQPFPIPDDSPCPWMRLLIAEYQDPRNGLFFCTGALLLFLAVLGFNRTFRDKWTTPLDYMFGGIGKVLSGSTVCIAVIFLLGLLYVGARHAEFHFDAQHAAEVFASENMGQVTNAGQWMFAVDENDVTHIASMKPALIRALSRQGVKLPPDRERQMAVPGLSPIFLALAIAGWGMYRRLKDSGSDDVAGLARQTRGAGLLLLVSLYVVGWLVVGNVGNEIQIVQKPVQFLESLHDYLPSSPEQMTPEVFQALTSMSEFELNEKMAAINLAKHQILEFELRMKDWMFRIVVLVAIALFVMIAAIVKYGDGSLDDETRAGWGFVFFTLQLFLLVGVAVVSDSLVSMPLILWGLTYLTALAAAWAATQSATFWSIRSGA